jgi:hypothetical protein
MAPELLERVEARIKSIPNSSNYEIKLTPLNNENIQLEVHTKFKKVDEPGFRKIRKIIHINEEIHLNL